MMNCEKCIEKCKAACCGISPFKREFVKKNPPKRKVITETDLGNEVALETEGWVCAYLGDDYRCTVYDKRPEVCKLFGSEKHPALVCPYQDKDGRIRSRQERRNIERSENKMVEKIWKNKNKYQ